jgi:hypothetical protein
MMPVVEVIASFVAGVIMMPFIFEGYSFLRRRELQKYFTNQKEVLDHEHKARMHRLARDWNDAVETHNNELLRMKKRLKHRGIVLESDDDNNLVVVKRVLVKTSFMEWLKQKRW